MWMLKVWKDRGKGGDGLARDAGLGFGRPLVGCRRDGRYPTCRKEKMYQIRQHEYLFVGTTLVLSRPLLPPNILDQLSPQNTPKFLY